METLIYLKNGDDYGHCAERTKAEMQHTHTQAKKDGHIGYLKGYRYFDNQKDEVIVYFTYKPDEAEISRRRLNGFRSARWHWL